jgi:hypothetical protein
VCLVCFCACVWYVFVCAWCVFVRVFVCVWCVFVRVCVFCACLVCFCAFLCVCVFVCFCACVCVWGGIRVCQVIWKCSEMHNVINHRRIALLLTKRHLSQFTDSMGGKFPFRGAVGISCLFAFNLHSALIGLVTSR